MTDLPLVSVCTITYNSSKTVLETLDSIYAQTYQKLELLVSDDCSTDDTVEVCRQWIEAHKDRFVRAEMIVREKNGGVAANLNTAIRACRGEWIKSIAGDDLLMQDCIKENIDYISNHENQGIVFSKVQCFCVEKGQRILMNHFLPGIHAVKFEQSASGQYQALLRSNFPPSTSVFYRKELLMAVPFPEDYPFCEDYPQWLHLTKNGIKLCYFDKQTAYYRVGESLLNPGSHRFVNEKFHYSVEAFFYYERVPALLKTNPELVKHIQREFLLGDIAILLLNNRRNFITKVILFIFKLFLGTRIVQ